MQPHGLYSPWTSPGQNTAVGSLSLLQGIFPTQGLNSSLLHFRQILYHLSHQGSPKVKVKVAQLCLTLCSPWTIYTVHGLYTVHGIYMQSTGFSRQEYWSGLPCPPPGALPNPGIKPASLASPALAGRFFTSSTIWEAPGSSVVRTLQFCCRGCEFYPWLGN